MEKINLILEFCCFYQGKYIVLFIKYLCYNKNMKKLTFHPKIQMKGRYSKKSFSALKIFNNKNKAFTLIELLVVIAIIGILAGVVIASLNSARTSGRVASIKSNLKNLQTQAQLYHLDNGTFAGLCAYNKTGISPHSSIQPMIDALVSIAGAGNIRCVVRTSNVPDTTLNTHYVPEDSLETRNFGVAVYYNNRHYGVDTTGVITLDANDINDSTTLLNWANANNTCASLGKRLPSVEILKAINDYGAQSGNLSFVSGAYWSSTSSSSSYAYPQNFNNGSVNRHSVTNGRYVRCAA